MQPQGASSVQRQGSHVHGWALATVGMGSIITTHLMWVGNDRGYSFVLNDSGNHVQVGQLLYPRNR